MFDGMHEVLTTQEMYEADRLTIEGGVPGIDLMEKAGQALARAVLDHWPQAYRIMALCGPGNNGGDGYVVGRLLREQGLIVQMINVLPAVGLTGDAAIAAERFDGAIEALSDDVSIAKLVADLENCDVVVDAIFGAGLARNLGGVVAELVGLVNACNKQVLSVDIPSGVDGDTGAICGCAVGADVTVTFFRHKPGHLLMPGRTNCGWVQVADIGIADQVLETIKPQCFVNGPELWQHKLPVARADQHKYDRGHVISVSGGHGKTGAARLAARGALRAGAGLVSVASPPDALAENAAQLTAIMIKAFEGVTGLAELLGDTRLNSVVIGPGCGVDPQTRDSVLAVLSSGANTVIDADGISSFAGEDEIANELFSAIKSRSDRDVVMTPHNGEFKRLFSVKGHSKTELARKSALLSGATIVYKGADTVIASPQSDAVINVNAPASLATAGSGDVLAGMIAGLMAQGMSGFDAACTGVWIHGEAARLFGPGLIAEDIAETMPRVWSELVPD